MIHTYMHIYKLAYIHTYILQQNDKYLHTYIHTYLSTLLTIYQRVIYTTKINKYHQPVKITESMQTHIHTLLGLHDSNSHFLFNLCEYESMDMYVCAAWILGQGM